MAFCQSEDIVISRRTHVLRDRRLYYLMPPFYFPDLPPFPQSSAIQDSPQRDAHRVELRGVCFNMFFNLNVSNRDRERKATKVAQDMLVQFREIQALLSTMNRRIRAPKITAKLGDVDPVIVSLGCGGKYYADSFVLTLYSIGTVFIHNEMF